MRPYGTLYMGKRNALYQLTDMIVFDEECFERAVPQIIRQNLKSGHGSQRQINVAIMAESVPLENIETSEISNQCRFFKMIAWQTQKAIQVEDGLSDSVSLDSVVITDKSTSYLNMADFI